MSGPLTTALDCLHRSARLSPHRLAVIGPLHAQANTYSELHSRCQQLAAFLQHLPASRLALLTHPGRREALEVAFAAAATRGRLCLLDAQLEPAQIAAALRHAAVEVLFADTQLAPLISAVSALILVGNEGVQATTLPAGAPRVLVWLGGEAGDGVDLPPPRPAFGLSARRCLRYERDCFGDVRGHGGNAAGQVCLCSCGNRSAVAFLHLDNIFGCRLVCRTASQSLLY
jgi:hypothetical protein